MADKNCHGFFLRKCNIPRNGSGIQKSDVGMKKQRDG
jgi:hypothetical protein